MLTRLFPAAFIIFALWGQSLAATRFYLPSTGNSAVNPAIGAWDESSAFTRRAMVRTRINSAMTQSSHTKATTANTNRLHRQYVSEPIPAQTITGTFSGQVRCSQGQAGNNHDRVTIRLLVVSNDGATERGTLLSLGEYDTQSNFTSGISENEIIANGQAVTSVVAQENDRIVLEVGVKNTNTGSGGMFSNLTFGDDSATDLTAGDETETSAFNPWIEFSQNLFDGAPTARRVNLITEIKAGTKETARGAK